MKKTPLVLALLGLSVSMSGCDSSKPKPSMSAQEMAQKAGNMAAAGKDMAEQAAAGAENALATAGDLLGKAKESLASVEGGSEMLQKVQDSFGSLTKLFGDIKDEGTAQNAVGEIGKITETFGGMSDMFGKLPEAAKGTVAKIFESSLGSLKPIIDKVMEIPGVSTVLKPAVDALLAKLGDFKA